jgi:hypothetical protein
MRHDCERLKTMNVLHWLLHTDGGLLTRIIVGVAIFTALGIADLAKHGRNATRWREYGVLAIAAAAAIGYGIVNDLITSSISWEYFFYGKELKQTLGPAIPPDMAHLHWQAVLVGVKATWSAGLIFGVALLLANNLWRGSRLRRLRNRQLVHLIPMILLTAATLGVVFGILGYFGRLTFLSDDFKDMWQMNYYRPRRFMCTWGIHLGGYLGGFAGTIIAIAAVFLRRRRLALAMSPPPRSSSLEAVSQETPVPAACISSGR